MHLSATDVRNSQESDEVFALRARVADLERHIGLLWVPPRVLCLTRSQSRALGLIVKHPALCSRELLFDALFGEREDPPSDENIRMHIRNLRRALAPHGVEIGNVWGVGYFITPDNIARLDGLYVPGERQETP